MQQAYKKRFIQNQFIVGSANITELDEGAKAFPIITKNQEANVRAAMSNSFGFGGTNAALVFKAL